MIGSGEDEEVEEVEGEGGGSRKRKRSASLAPYIEDEELDDAEEQGDLESEDSEEIFGGRVTQQGSSSMDPIALED